MAIFLIPHFFSETYITYKLYLLNKNTYSFLALVHVII